MCPLSLEFNYVLPSWNPFFSHTHSSSKPVLGIHLFNSSFVIISLLNSTYSHPLCIPERCFVADNLLGQDDDPLRRNILILSCTSSPSLKFRKRAALLKKKKKRRAALFSSCLMVHLCSVCHPLKPGLLELLT